MREPKFKPGDRVVHNSGSYIIVGTVVKLQGARKDEIGVQWDHVTYNSEFQYSMPRKSLIRKLSKLDKALT